MYYTKGMFELVLQAAWVLIVVKNLALLISLVI
uniref:Uncharacterized protein n=1 Tax=Arundo donax TaxID=35708 RepID=A0A0A9HCY9_ARUDO